MNKETLIKELNELSLNARISYAIMCLENYVNSKHKDIDFTILFNDLWKINTAKLIDTEWYYPMMARSVSAVMEFGNYTDSDYSEDDNITEKQYNDYFNLYQKIQDDKELCTIIDTIINLPVHYLYTSVDDDGIKITSDIMKIVDILLKENIETPSTSLLKDSQLSISDYTTNLDSSSLTNYSYLDN